VSIPTLLASTIARSAVRSNRLIQLLHHHLHGDSRPRLVLPRQRIERTGSAARHGHACDLAESAVSVGVGECGGVGDGSDGRFEVAGDHVAVALAVQQHPRHVAAGFVAKQEQKDQKFVLPALAPRFDQADVFFFGGHG
jgi:hypothetical protein